MSLGPIQARVLLGAGEIARASRGLSADLRKLMFGDGRAMLAHLASMGVQHLSSIDASLDRQFMASAWTHTGVQTSTSGGMLMWAEIYSRAERMTLNRKTTAADGSRVRSSRHPVGGSDLIRMLQRGTPRHEIAPGPGNHSDDMIVYPPQPSGRPSLRRTVRGKPDSRGIRDVKGHFLGSKPRSVPEANGLVVAPSVPHPGMGGTQSIAHVGAILESEARRAGQRMLGAIHRRFRG